MRRVACLLFFLVLLGSVSAQDFFAAGETSLVAQPCSVIQKNLTIQNTRDTLRSYELSVDGSGSDFVTFSQIGFALNPGDSQTVAENVNVPCDTRAGTYDVSVFFSDGEFEKQLDQELNVRLETLNLTAESTSQVIAPCGVASYNVTVANPANFTERYTISVSGYPDAHVSEKGLVLRGLEQKDVVVSVIPSDCTDSGSFPLNVDVSAEKSGEEKSLGLEFIITSRDIPIIAPGVSKIRTDYVDSTAELSIENTGDRDTTYKLGVEGVDWASLSVSAITLKPGESQVLRLRLAPTTTVLKGTYPVTVRATVADTDISYTKELTVRLLPPTVFEKNPVPFIGGAIVIILLLVGLVFLVKYLRSSAFKVKYAAWKARVEEKRKVREAAREVKRKADDARKEEERKKKEAQREKDRERARAQLEREYKKDYHFIARKDFAKGKKSKQQGMLPLVIILAIAVVLVLALWKFIAPNLAYVVLGMVVLLALAVIRKVSRKFVVRAVFRTLLPEHPVSMRVWKRGLSILSVSVEQPTKSVVIEARKKSVKASPSPAVYQSFEFKSNVEASYQATLTVPKGWIARKNVAWQDVRLAKYVNQQWKSVPVDRAGEGASAVHFTAKLVPGTYAIFVRPKQKEVVSRKKIIVAACLIGVALLVAFAFVVSSPQNPSNVIPPQVWKAGTVHELDLSPFFKDPDGDALKLSATKAGHITIDFIGSKAVMTPDASFVGEEKVTFTADDGKGGVITSNTVSLRVERTWVPLKFQPIVGVVLGLLAIVLLVFAVYRLQKKE